jgi:crossover junction endodeoxyribonuclease RusA
MILLKLPPPVSANRYWRTRVVTPRGAAPFVSTYVSTEAKEWKELVGWIAKAAGVRAPLQGRIGIEYTLHPKRPQDWAQRAKRDPNGWQDTVQCIDLDNAQKVLLDALKGIVFDDDKWVRQIIAKRGEPLEEGCLIVAVRQVIDVVQPSLLEVASQ